MSGVTSPSRPKQADLWESTIAVAVRDMQWICRRDTSVAPEANLNMKGRAETALGDSFVTARDRMYLFELKSTEDGKEREWKEGGEKRAYLALAASLEGFDDKSEEERLEIMRMLWASVRSHYFVYWDGSGATSAGEHDGGLVFSSYLLDSAQHMLDKSNDKASTPAKLLKTFSLTDRRASSGQRDNAFKQLSLVRLFQRTAFALRMKIDQGAIVRATEPVGLRPAELQKYVDWLVGMNKGGCLPINALLVSRDGTFIRHVSDISQAAQLLANISAKKHMSLAQATVIRSLELAVAPPKADAQSSPTSSENLQPAPKRGFDPSA